MDEHTADWRYDVQEGDILLLQTHLRALLVIFGITQDEAAFRMEVGKSMLQKFMRFERVMSVQQYTTIRSYLQSRTPKTILQKEALFYCTHRMQNSAIVQQKLSDIHNLVFAFKRNTRSTAEYAIELSQLWLQLKHVRRERNGKRGA